MRTFDVLGTPLQATNYDEFTKFCQSLAPKQGTWAVDLTNTQVVTMRRHEPDFREITSRFDYFLADGMPLIWCLNAKGAQLRDRVYGPTFMRQCILNSPAPYKHYLLGGSVECLDRLKQRLLEQQSFLQIVGSHHGYFQPEDEANILDEINRLSPDFIWVGLGTPKQQIWIHNHKSRINRGVIFGVGFAFDVNAGTKKDAPEWMQRRGLTWVFRLFSEPRRLGPRYFKYNLLFLFYLAKDFLSRREKKVPPVNG
jgi:N-acetylglucosaminyldiphosphoundecaprenol N-acetyl-beta-D-mannosaminyltransferase